MFETFKISWINYVRFTVYVQVGNKDFPQQKQTEFLLLNISFVLFVFEGFETYCRNKQSKVNTFLFENIQH